MYIFFFQICWANTISTSEEWSSIGKEANGGVNNNEATNNLHLLASAGLDDLAKEDSGGDIVGGLEDADSNTSTPRKRKRSSDDNNTNNGKNMQTDVVRVPGLSQDLQQQITKFDSSEFDVSITNINYNYIAIDSLRNIYSFHIKKINLISQKKLVHT